LPEGGASSRVLLSATGIRKAFGGHLILDNVSLNLHAGEVVVLRGNNGSGKTTLLNILTGNIEPDSGMIQLFTNGTNETFVFPKRWWQNLIPFDHFTPERIARKSVGRTWQDIRLFQTQSLRDNIAVAVPNQLGENPLWSIFRRSAVLKQEKDVLSLSKALIADLGLDGRESSSGDRVSLGQSKRVAIGRSIRAGARILFLDEPLAGLDAAGTAEILDLLRKIASKGGVTLVLVEHVLNLPHILNLATTLWTLSDKKVVVESADKSKAEIRTTATKDISRHVLGLNGLVADNNVSRQELLGGAILAHFRSQSVEPSDAVLEVKDLVVYRGKRLVIGKRSADGETQGLTFSLYKGDIAVLQAPNGWGKTTLLEAIAGLTPISRGSIRLLGKPINKLLPWERVAIGLALLQARNNAFSELTVEEVLRLSNIAHPPPEVTHLLARRMSDLSGGERQKVSIACALAQPSVVLMLDEPFSALDTTGLSKFWEAIKAKQSVASLVALPSAVKEGYYEP
jgi:ABC-type branched-subunit amino acid transport system ATPase component